MIVRISQRTLLRDMYTTTIVVFHWLIRYIRAVPIVITGSDKIDAHNYY